MGFWIPMNRHCSNCIAALFGDKIEEKMRVRAKNKKPTPFPFPCNAGSRFSTSALIWTLIGCLFIYYLLATVHHNHNQTRQLEFIGIHPRHHELEVVEEEKIIKKPPPRKRSPRAIRRKPNKRFSAIVNEFLDEESPLRTTFFPGKKNAINPMIAAGNDSFHYFPGRVWLDTDGNPIQAHGGGILYDKRSTMYYWYGEYKDGPTYHAHKKGSARVSYLNLHLQLYFKKQTNK